jgi:hypothetical protein
MVMIYGQLTKPEIVWERRRGDTHPILIEPPGMVASLLKPRAIRSHASCFFHIPFQRIEL